MPVYAGGGSVRPRPPLDLSQSEEHLQVIVSAAQQLQVLGAPSETNFTWL